jgi:hypothetical protein
LDLRGSDSHLQGNPWRCGGRLTPGGLLDDLPLGLEGSFRSLRGLWCQLLHGHPCRDVTYFSACQQTTRISAYDYSSRSSTASRRVLTFDYDRLWQRRFGCRGSVAAWASGAGSSTDGATSPASAVEGSSPSQLRSVDFLQKYSQRIVRQNDYCIKYYS